MVYGRRAPRRQVRRRGGAGRGGCARLLIAAVIAGIALFSYMGKRQYNPVTGETQAVSMTPDQEIALGVRAAPEMAAQHGGLYQDARIQEQIDAIGERLVRGTAAAQTPYRFEFHVLADERTVNAFALPGGQVFITYALLSRLETEGQVAAVLGHEIGHVVGRHSAERVAKQELMQGLTGAAVMATYDPASGGGQMSAAMAAMVANVVQMKFGRGDELQSDRLGVEFAAQVGYDPRAAVRVMEILAEASGAGRQPEFFSTHPNPDNRIERILQAVQEIYPNGVPASAVP
ncbi:MAG: M48 family metallopeptidase [Acidobacteriota bacterium]